MGGAVNITEPSKEARTIVLVGRAGNGKSATGNNILGRDAFESKSNACGVTSTSEMQSTILSDGQVVNVIDTPGLYEFSMEAIIVAKEIINCIRLAKDGIHAFLFVFSAKARFTKEEQAAFKSLLTFFGHKIVDYMIIVFTGGDELGRNKQTLNDYLGHERERPEAIQEILQLCKHRLVLFNNNAHKVSKKGRTRQLLSVVDKVIKDNGGKPYKDEFFIQWKEGVSESSEGYFKQEISVLKDNLFKSYEEQLKRITEMVEQRLTETVERLEQRLEEEQAARKKAEQLAKAAQIKSSCEINELRGLGQRLEEEQTAKKAEQLAKAAQIKSSCEINEFRESLDSARQLKTEEAKKGSCAIL